MLRVDSEEFKRVKHAKSGPQDHGLTCSNRRSDSAVERRRSVLLHFGWRLTT